MVNWFNRLMDRPDLGKLILRLAFSIMMMFHGWHKLIDGIENIQGMLAQHSLPGFIGYGVFIGELVAPLLMVLGILTRPAALVFSFTMLVAYLLIDPGKVLMLTPVGAWGAEDIAVYFFAGLAIAFLGSGRYSVMKKPDWR
ncbi:DoxX family protein [Serratia sp. UGAL515B_01]|uniref:DoxX family protein n=1 Tax=Serratia sp. UGAL515B_01 TaxID=2986763 RepID=UPI0029531AFF|nr:DoxX family protein [Serratia sp. UGAL515B_01]WON77244.1 DoxX family protein [Serratia sp. UGAL515B_01]